MKNDHVKFRRAKETKFLICDEVIFDKFSPFALKVYGQLRKLVSYTQQCDEIEVTVKNLAVLSGISERKTYEVLNELENDHYIIQREKIYHIKYGQVNSFLVSQTYAFFKSVQSETTTAPQENPVDNSGQNLSPTALYAVPTAPHAVPTAPGADIYNKEQESLQEVSQEKQNKEPIQPVEKPVSVFSCKEDVKTHVENIVSKRGNFIEEEIADQITWYASKYLGNNSEIKKKVNIALKKVREGKWNIPQGYQGITSQSIREKEEQQSRQKAEQYQQEAKSFQEISKAILSPCASSALAELKKKLASG
jgi:hypothetical protein